MNQCKTALLHSVCTLALETDSGRQVDKHSRVRKRRPAYTATVGREDSSHHQICARRAALRERAAAPSPRLKARGLHSPSRQPRRVPCLRAARPRDAAARDRGRVNLGTAPAPRPAPPDAAEEAPPRGRLARVGVAPEAHQRAHSRRKRRWAPAPVPRPAPVSTRSTTC